MVYDITFGSHFIRYSTVSVSLLMMIEKFYDFFFFNSVFIYFTFLFVVVIRTSFYL